MKSRGLVFQFAGRVLPGLVSAALLCTMPMSALAQGTSGTILGAVTDQDGAVIAAANIVARNVLTNAWRSMSTDGAGRFRIEELPLGEYEVQAEHDKFKKTTHSGIVLTLGRDAVVNFTLKVGAVTEELTVSGDVSLVNTTNPQISSLVSQRTITELPLNGRDLFQLAALQNGVVNVGSLVKDPIDAGTGAVKMAINGGRITFNNVLFDGASVNEAENTTPGSAAGGFTGVEAVQEFQLITHNYSAEFGGAGGGIINLVSKPGTNFLHGSAFEFLRNSALDARNFFDQRSVPPFRRNQFGGSAGGPIQRDRTFLFVAYEGLRQELAQTQRFFVPTEAARLTASATAGPYVNLYPQANAGDAGGGLGIFIRNQSGQTDEDYFTVRADNNFSPQDAFFARYTFDDSSDNEPDHVISNTVLDARNQYTGLRETHLFSSRLLSVARFAYDRSRVFGDLQDVEPVPLSLVWVPGQSVLGAFANVGGLSPLSDRNIVPRFLIVNNFEGSEQIDYTRGSHSIKFGFTARRIQLNAQSTTIAAGTFIFGSYQAFLRAQPELFAAPLADANDAYRGIRTTLFAGYAQDDWRVRRNFTLNLGLRYEPMTSPSEATNKVANLRDPLHDTATTVGSPFFKNNTLTNFAPRMGFAWDIMGDGKTSLRAGYGLFFAQAFPYAYRLQMSNQLPYFGIGIVFAPSFPHAFGELANVPGLIAANTYQYDPPPTYVQQWNLSLQHEFMGGVTATIAYVGSRGEHLPTNGNVNTASDFTILPDGQKQFPVGVPNPLRNPAFGPIIEVQDTGDSCYHALEVGVERRIALGLQFQIAYTFSKSIDTSSDSAGYFLLASAQYPQDVYNLHADRGLSVFDVRNNFALNMTYQLPYKAKAGAVVGRRVADWLLGGWELNSIVTAHSGTPFNPTISFNNSNDGNPNEVERPNWAPGFNPQNAVTGNPNQYFNPNAFVLAPPGQYGTVGRNVLIGPGLFTFDLSLVKSSKIGERVSVQFRAEGFNILNHVNFALPGDLTVFTSGGIVPPDAGQITQSSTPSRQLQFGLRFVF
jgi:Carboxypeptidase regulatory-like domain/TonB dependent receptor